MFKIPSTPSLKNAAQDIKVPMWAHKIHTICNILQASLRLHHYNSNEGSLLQSSAELAQFKFLKIQKKFNSYFS